MSTEIKTNEEKTGYSFEATVSATEKLMLDTLRKVKQGPPPMAVFADDVGIQLAPIPSIDGMSNGEVISRLGSALAQNGKKVNCMGVVCEAYVSNRTDIKPSEDPKAKEVVFMLFGDDTGRKEMRMFTHQNGKVKKVKGMKGTTIIGLVDEFWQGYKTPPASADGSNKTPTVC